MLGDRSIVSELSLNCFIAVAQLCVLLCILQDHSKILCNHPPPLLPPQPAPTHPLHTRTYLLPTQVGYEMIELLHNQEPSPCSRRSLTTTPSHQHGSSGQPQNLKVLHRSIVLVVSLNCSLCIAQLFSMGAPAGKGERCTRLADSSTPCSGGSLWSACTCSQICENLYLG